MQQRLRIVLEVLLEWISVIIEDHRLTFPRQRGHPVQRRADRAIHRIDRLRRLDLIAGKLRPHEGIG